MSATRTYPTAEFVASALDWQEDVLGDFDKGRWRFALVNAHRRARKTSLALNFLIREAWRHDKSRYGFVTSTFVAAKNIVWRDKMMLDRWLIRDSVARKNDSELFVELTNGSIISIHGSDKPDSLRGVDFRGVVIDEAPLCKEELWTEILRPIIAQSKDRWAMFIFTPKNRNWVYQLWNKARDNPEWYRYLLTAGDSGIIPFDELEKIKKEIPQAIYEQEFCGAFNTSSSSVFKNIENCVTGQLESPKQNKTYVTGIDLARSEDFTVLVTICREDRKVVDFERFNQIDWPFQKERILRHCKKWNSFPVIDATGIGDPIVQDLEAQGLRCHPFKIGPQSKKELIERLMVTIEQRLITFPKIDVLIEELGLYAYDISEHGNVRFSAPEGCHDDSVIALALAVFGMKNFIYGKAEKKRVSKLDVEQVSNAGIGY